MLLIKNGLINDAVNPVPYKGDILVDEGKIIEMGTHRQLLRKGGAYYNLYTSQWEEDEQDKFFKKLQQSENQ